MSGRRSQPEDLRVVRELARESAELPVPPIDWARIEEQLFVADAAQMPSPVIAPPARPRARWRWIGALAVAASIATTWWTQANRRPQPMLSSRVIAPTIHDAEGWTVDTPLQLGDIVESGAEGFHYAIPGVVTFSLAEDTSIAVVALDTAADPPSLTVELRRGAIRADVIHRAHGEAFGVEVGGTRVAVHGTSFSVVREGDRALVDVTHGSVAVGPVGHRGATKGWLVNGPDRASFSLDGAKDVRWLEPVRRPDVAAEPSAAAPLHTSPEPARGLAVGKAPRAVPAREPTASAPSSTSAAPAIRDPETPPTVDRAAVQTTEVAAILGKIAACHANQASSAAVRFSVDTMLTLSLYPTGMVRQGWFDPPLSPTLMRCAGDAINQARFAAAEEPTEILVPVHLPQN